MWYENKNDDEMWTPIGSEFADNREWIEKHFPKDKRYETVIFYSENNANILKSSTIQYVSKKPNPAVFCAIVK